MKSLSILLLVLYSSFTFGKTPYLDSLEEKLKVNNYASIDAFLGSLPKEFLSTYSLVYSSRSLQSASPLKPRVILRTPDNQFYMTFNDGNGSRPGDKDIEIIEAYGLNAPTFATISWQSGKPVLNKNPTNCFTCHKGVPVMDEYPHWPGFYASSANGGLYGKKAGSSKLSKFEFEERYLEEFKKEAPKLSNYRHLVDLASKDLFFFERQNANLDIVVHAQLEERHSKQIYESITTVEELNEAFVSSFPFTTTDWVEVFRSKTDPTRQDFLTEEKYKPYRDFRASYLKDYEAAAASSAQARFERFRDHVAKFGTDADKTNFLVVYPYARLDLWNPAHVPYPPVRSDLGLPGPHIMNYSTLIAAFREPSLYYHYWRKTHPAAETLPFTTELPKSEVKHIGGNTIPLLLSSYVLGYSSTPTQSNPGGGDFSQAPRNFRDFTELYDWVAEPLKRFTWAEFEKYPDMKKQIDEIQKGYLEIISTFPAPKPAGAETFLQLKSWSPENRAKLEEILVELAKEAKKK